MLDANYYNESAVKKMNKTEFFNAFESKGLKLKDGSLISAEDYWTKLHPVKKKKKSD